MKTFIRVVELWVPDRTRTRLEFGGCLCSDEYSEFKAVSENVLFAYDDGLPGKAWPARLRPARPRLESRYAAHHQGFAQRQEFSALGGSERNRDQLRRRYSLQHAAGSNLGHDVPVGAGNADRETL